LPGGDAQNVGSYVDFTKDEYNRVVRLRLIQEVVETIPADPEHRHRSQPAHVATIDQIETERSMAVPDNERFQSTFSR
jgi:hypothetical protein